MTEPFLLTEKQARALLAGADPAKLIPPLYIGARKYWSRAALDRAVREKAGLPPARDSGKPESAYDDWKRSEEQGGDGARRENHH